MKDKFKQPKIDMTRYAVEIKGDITPTMGVDNGGTGKPSEIIGVKVPEGKGGGSIIVDSLPAQGLEGSTYLLRKKDESKVFKAQAYVPLYQKSGGDSDYIFITMIDPDIDFLLNVITERLNPNLSNGLVNFGSLRGFLSNRMKSSEEWNTLRASNKVAIVKTEEEVSKITGDVDYIFQDLGVIGIEDLNIYEIRQTEGSSLAEIDSVPNSICYSLVVQNDKVIAKARKIVAVSESGTGQKTYKVVDDPSVSLLRTYAGTLTDTYVYNRETLTNLEENAIYFINLTPMAPSYSYTQYVFDQGVYTVIGGDTGSKLFTIQIKGRTDDSNNYSTSLTTQVETNKLTNFNDLQAYLEEKGYLFYYSSGEGSGFVLQAAGTCSYYVVTGIYTSGYSIEIICSNGDIYSLRAADLEITYSGE